MERLGDHGATNHFFIIAAVLLFDTEVDVEIYYKLVKDEDEKKHDAARKPRRRIKHANQGDE